MDIIVDVNGVKITIEGAAHSVSDPFVDKLVQTRKQMKLTQQNISDATGIDRGNIGRVEGKKYVPTLDVLVKYAAALGYTLELNLIKNEENS